MLSAVCNACFRVTRVNRRWSCILHRSELLQVSNYMRLLSNYIRYAGMGYFLADHPFISVLATFSSFHLLFHSEMARMYSYAWWRMGACKHETKGRQREEEKEEIMWTCITCHNYKGLWQSYVGIREVCLMCNQIWWDKSEICKACMNGKGCSPRLRPCEWYSQRNFESIACSWLSAVTLFD